MRSWLYSSGLGSMPVPPEDTVCRFIVPDRSKWNPKQGKPTQRAFKQADLSVWDKDKLESECAQLEDLQKVSFMGWGQVHHLVDDYFRHARDVEQQEREPFKIQVEWRPETVPAELWEWRYAHAQVEATEGPVDFPLEFRRRLAAEYSLAIAPERCR